MNAHLISTMMNETVAMEVRLACAKPLLRDANSQIRSVAYWFIQRKRMSTLTKMWWEKHNN